MSQKEISQKEYNAIGEKTKTCGKCNQELVKKTFPNQDPNDGEGTFDVYGCDNCKIQFDICPKCNLATLEHGYDSCEMGQFEYDKCHNKECNHFEMINSRPPAWFIEESRMNSRNSRILPCGTIEYAGPYGGY